MKPGDSQECETNTSVWRRPSGISEVLMAFVTPREPHLFPPRTASLRIRTRKEELAIRKKYLFLGFFCFKYRLKISR